MAIVDKYISHITPLDSPDTYKLKAYLLKNGRTFKVKLDSTNASTAFNGSANITDIGVTGVLSIANGGTGANSRVNAYKALAYAGEFTGDIDATNNEAGIWGLGADNSYTGESLKTDLGITTLPTWSIFYQLPYVNTQLIFDGNPGQIYIRDREGSSSSLAWKTWKVLKQKPDNAGHADTAAALSPAGTTAQFWRGDNTWSNELSGGQLKITNYSNTVTIGSGNANYTHFNNSADIPFYFNKSIWVDGDLYPYGTSNTRSLGSSSKRWKSLFIGTSNDYGTQYIPIYWNAGVPTQITTNSVLTNLASTTAASTYAASPRPGVTGTLGTANGGTGNTSFTKDTLIYANTATKLASYTSTKGGTKKLWYLNAGVPTDSSDTVGATDKPVFLSSGTITASTSTIGSGIIPIYMTSGQIKASTSTVGSFEKPTYLNAGTITALNPVWLLSGGTATANNEDLNAAKYKAIGNYYSDGDAKSKTILNSPFGAAASTNCLSFTLKTEASLGTGTTYLRQLWRGYNSGVEAERTSTNSGSSWSTWRTKVFKNSDAATAAGDNTTPVYVTANGAVATGYPYLRYINSTDVTTYSVDELGKTASIAYIRATDTNAPTSGHMMYINAGIGHMGTPFQIGIHDSSNLYVYKRWYSSSAWSAWTKMNAGNADTASKLTDITTADAASSSATWRYVWFSYNDNTTGRPAYSSNLVFQTSTNTLKATKFQGALVGNADTATAANITSTDNAIVRFDGTAGKFQNSKASVDDSGGITLGGSYLIIKPFSSTYDTTGSHAGIKFYFNHDRSGYNADTLIANYSLQATNFYGALKGNADTATAFSSNATVTLTGDTTGTSAGSTKSWSVPTVTSALTVKGGRVATADSAHAAADYSKMYLRIATNTMTTNKPKFSVEGETPATHDGHILEFHWDNSGIYNEQLALSNTNAAMSIRACPNSATWHNWTPILTSTNVLWSAWGAGTTAGPTAKLNIGGTTITSAAIPSASTSASGIVTTAAQTFAGTKTFTNPETINSTGNGAAINFKFSNAASANAIYGQNWITYANNGGRFYWREWGGTADGRTDGYEQYCLPACNAGRTTTATYDIFTSKNQAAPSKGTANRAAYYSAADTIEDAGSIYMSASHITINGTDAPANFGNFQVIGTSTMRTILPQTDATYDLGNTATLRWKNGFFTTSLRVGPKNTTTGSTTDNNSYIGPDGFWYDQVTTGASYGYVLRGKGVNYANLFVNTLGIANTIGEVILQLGNATTETAVNNARGRIRFYGAGTKYIDLIPNQTGTNGNYTQYLPQWSGYSVTHQTTAHTTMAADYTAANWNAGTQYIVGSGATGDAYITDIARIARRVYQDGTAGYSQILLGNTLGSGVGGNAYGSLVLYGTNGNYTNLRANPSGNRTMYLPEYAATGYLVCRNTAGGVGTASTPIYVDANGCIQACTAYGSATDIRAATVNIHDDTTSKLFVLGATTTGYTSVYRESSVYMQNNVLRGAAWNDYAEFRQSKENKTIEPGRVVHENGDDTLSISTQRLMRGCNIVSDTYGFSIGESEEAQLPIAVSGRVLAYPYESKEEFKNHIGWPVCSGPNGTVSIMTEEEEIKYPSRIIGIISAVPDYEIWHGGADVIVDGRVWIKVR